MMSAQSLFSHKVALSSFGEAPSSSASTCCGLSRQNSAESLGSGTFLIPDTIREDPSAIALAEESKGTRLPFAQKRFAIRVSDDVEVQEESHQLEHVPSPASDSRPTTFMERRFEIRMGDDGSACHSATSPEKSDVRSEVAVEVSSHTSLAQKRFAIRMQDDSRFASVWQSEKKGQAESAESDKRGAMVSPSTVATDRDQASQKSSALPLAQKRFGIRMHRESSFWGESDMVVTQAKPQPENLAPPETFAQKRFAIRMHDEIDATNSVAAVMPLAEISNQPAAASFSQRRFAARMHEFE